MFENLVNLFNQQSTLVQVVVVAIVAYVIYLLYLELTKEKFSAGDVCVNKINLLNDISKKSQLSMGDATIATNALDGNIATNSKQLVFIEHCLKPRINLVNYYKDKELFRKRTTDLNTRKTILQRIVTFINNNKK
jgi:hypothetical protein